MAHHRDDVAFVPDYQMHGIKFIDDLCTFPEFTAVGTVFGSERQGEVMVEPLSGLTTYLFTRSREIWNGERSASSSRCLLSIRIETYRDSPLPRGVKHMLHSSPNRIFLALPIHQFQRPALSETIEGLTPVPVVIVNVQYGDFRAR